jgi:hypothetical protein
MIISQKSALILDEEYTNTISEKKPLSLLCHGNGYIITLYIF